MRGKSERDHRGQVGGEELEGGGGREGLRPLGCILSRLDA